MSNLRYNISDLIPSQFGEYFAENGPVLIEFIQAYYKWLETDGQPLWYAKNHLTNHDVDAAAAQFLIHYKNKYVPYVQLSTADSTRNMVKQSLPFYRSRGTDEAYQLFFRLVFDVDVNIYKPYQDTFSLSSGLWNKDTYLEVSPNPNNNGFLHQEIIGINSGATAFVDKLTHRNLNGRKVDVFYISAITGAFEYGELVVPTANADIKNATMITGSLNELEIIDGSENFSVGETVNLYSTSGVLATGLVNNTVTQTGLVSFSLENGGWGYSSNTKVYVSDTVVSLVNVQRPLLPFSNTLPYFLDPIVQPVAEVYYDAANGVFTFGSMVTIANSSNGPMTTGLVQAVSGATQTTGTLLVTLTNAAVVNANNVAFIYSSNVSASVPAHGYTDLTATGEILNIPNACDIVVINASSTFVTGESFAQYNQNGIMVANGYISNVSSNLISVSNCTALPFTGTTMVGLVSNATAVVNTLNFKLGLSTNSTFYSSTNNLIYANTLFASGLVNTTSTGYGASFQVSNNRSYTQQSVINTDRLADYLTVPLNSITFPNLNNANATNTVTLYTALNWMTASLGGIELLVNINPGSHYNFSPVVAVIDPIVGYYNYHDYVFNIANATGIFNVGELITQSNTGAVGMVKSANSTTVYVSRMQFQEEWIANTNMLITGEQTGYAAKLTQFNPDTVSNQIGFNAVVLANTVTANGSVTQMTVTSSGFAFNRSITVNGQNEDFVTFSSADGLRTGKAFGILGGMGTSAGYWKNTKGFASADQKLYDGNYYQPFSYDIKTSISPDNYRTMVQNLLHTAGKKFFTSIEKNSVMDVSGLVENALYTVVKNSVFGNVSDASYITIL